MELIYDQVIYGIKFTGDNIANVLHSHAGKSEKPANARGCHNDCQGWTAEEAEHPERRGFGPILRLATWGDFQ